MDHICHLNRAINDIEAHLTQPLAVEQVAARIGYSRFHFDRLFLATVGDTLASYLRKRRLTEAAREIIHSDKPLLDIALDYQFQSQEAFTRSFKRMFGLSPGAYRRRRRLTRPFFKITLRPQRLFALYGSAQMPQLLLPSARLTTCRPGQTIALVAPRANICVFRQEMVHARYLAPTQFCPALGWASAFRHR
ncbi:MAG: helix-turn-helix domain-containing protein [Caldilineaceae bacterium]